MGDSFLRTFYTAYNVEDKTVGLAKATALRTGDECANDASISSPGVETGGATGDDAPAAPTPADVAAAAATPAPALAAAETATTASTSSAAPTAQETESSVPDTGTPAPQQAATSSAPAADAGSDAGGGGDGGSASEEGSSSDSDSGGDSGGDGDGGAVADLDGSSAGGGGDEADGGSSMAAVAAAASVGTLFAVALCGGLAVLVVRRIRRGEHRHAPLGGGGGGALELGGKGGRGGGGSTVVGAEDDFLQAGPGGYRGSGSGSHRYRVAAETGVAHGRGSADRLTVMGTERGGEEEEDGQHDDEVEVDFGVSRAAGGATPSQGPLGRIIGRAGRGGFAPFGDEEGGGLVVEQTSGL